jgi:hypothetical protein
MVRSNHMDSLPLLTLHGILRNQTNHPHLRDNDRSSTRYRSLRTKLHQFLLSRFKWHHSLHHTTLSNHGISIRNHTTHHSQIRLRQYRSMECNHTHTTTSEQLSLPIRQHGRILYRIRCTSLTHGSHLTTRLQKIHHRKHSIHQLILDHTITRIRTTLLSKLIFSSKITIFLIITLHTLAILSISCQHYHTLHSWLLISILLV